MQQFETARSLRKRRAMIMLRQRPYVTVAVPALLIAVLCGACFDPTSPSGMDGTALTAGRIGGTWTLGTQQPPGQAEVAPPAGAMFTAEIADGRAAITADCNSQGRCLDIPQRPWLVDAAFLARTARLATARRSSAWAR